MGLNFVVITPNLKVRNALIEAIEASGGIAPALQSDSESAQRAHYAPMESKAIINTASSQMHALLGKHSVAIALEVFNRPEAADAAVAVFQKHGFAAEAYNQAEPEFPYGFLSFVSVPALGGILLMFWPNEAALKNTDPEILKRLPQRKPWKDPE